MGTPYQYDVAYGYTNGLIGSQRHVVRPAGLATVQANYYSDVPTTGVLLQVRRVRSAVERALRGPVPADAPCREAETEYMTGNPAVLWSDSYEQSFQDLAGGPGRRPADVPGRRAADRELERLPAARGLQRQPDRRGQCGGHPAVGITRGQRPDPGRHAVQRQHPRPYRRLRLLRRTQPDRSESISGHYLITENGKTIAAGNPLQGAVGPGGEFHTKVTLSPRPATIRLALDATRKAKIYTLSTSSQTVWTWRSARESGAALPAGWGCAVTRTRNRCWAAPVRWSR